LDVQNVPETKIRLKKLSKDVVETKQRY